MVMVLPKTKLIEGDFGLRVMLSSVRRGHQIIYKTNGCYWQEIELQISRQ